jgi:hypothetical protein
LYHIEKQEKKTLLSKIYQANLPDQFLPGSNIKLYGKIKEIEERECQIPHGK